MEINMKKRKVIKIALSAVLLLLICASVGIYIYDIRVNGSAPRDNLAKMLSAVAICAAAAIRIHTRGPKRASLEFYASRYSEFVGNVFLDKPKERRKLLTALRLYNEEKYRAAIKPLAQLKSECRTREEVHAVGLFLALVLEDGGAPEDAAKIYEQLIEIGAPSPTVYSNLGSLYSRLGNYEGAISNLRLAVQNGGDKPEPINNLAQLYFKHFDFENAKKYALMTLEKNNNFYQASSLLGMIYTIEGEEELAEKYIHLAISTGQSPDKLRLAIEHYTALKRENDEDAEYEEALRGEDTSDEEGEEEGEE